MQPGGDLAVARVQYLRENESPPTEYDWIMIEPADFVWVVNSASLSDHDVPSIPIGPFHTRGEAVEAATDFARAKGIEVVYVRGT